MWKKVNATVFWILAALAPLNFLLYAIIAESIGGDAINGRVDAGRYYLGRHGGYTEVSHAVFNYSRLHTYVLWAHYLLFFIAGAALEIKSRRDRSKRKTGA